MSGGDASDKRGGGNGKSAPGRADVAKPKRFYEKAEAGERDGAHVVLLDGRAARTPGRQLLALPTRALAERVAGEWAAQGATLEPLTMPLTRLINSVLEGVRGRERAVTRELLAPVVPPADGGDGPERGRRGRQVPAHLDASG